MRARDAVGIALACFLIVLGLFCLIWGVIVHERRLQAVAPPAPTVAPVSAPVRHRQYKIAGQDGGSVVLPGDKIVSTGGPCIELWLSGRIDTIVCGAAYVTELPDDAPPAPVPTPMPEAPREQSMYDDSRIVRR